MRAVIVRPMIGGWEVPCIEHIATLESRRLARLGVPGLRGDLHHDLGTASLVVEIAGSLSGDDVRDSFLQQLRDQFGAGAPVSFVADIVTATEVDQVVIEAIEVEEGNDAATPFSYRLVLREYVEPPAPPGALDDLGAELDGELDAAAGLGLDGLELPGLLGSIPDLADPLPPLEAALDGVKSALQGLTGPLDSLRAALDGGV